MNAAHFVRVNGADRHGVDAKTFATGNDQHLRFVIEPLRAAEKFWNQLPVTLGNIVGGFLFTGLFLYWTYRPAPARATVLMEAAAEPAGV